MITEVMYIVDEPRDRGRDCQKDSNSFKKKKKKKKLKPTSLHRPAGHKRKRWKPRAFYVLHCSQHFTQWSVGTAAPAKTYPCQGLPACSPRPLWGPERERWGAGRRVQGEAGGRVARLELPDTGTRLTAGSNWLPSESLPLPQPEKVSAGPACSHFLLSLQLTRKPVWGRSSKNTAAQIHHTSHCTEAEANMRLQRKRHISKERKQRSLWNGSARVTKGMEYH